MMRRSSSLFALVSMASLAVACGGEVDVGNADATVLSMSDPCTGDTVGTFDQQTNTMLFSDGFEVNRGEIERVEAEDAPDLQCRVDTTETAAARTMSAWANNRCWHMFESYVGGYASCSGCCYPAGGGAYTCWESCSDFQHS